MNFIIYCLEKEPMGCIPYYFCKLKRGASFCIGFFPRLSQLGFFRGFSVVIDNYLITSLARGGPHAVGAGDMAKLHPAMEVHVRFQQVVTQQTG